MLRFLQRQATVALGLVCAFAVVAAVALGVARPAEATTASHPWYGIYECEGVGQVQIPAYFKLMGHGHYISALQLQGRTLKGTRAGRWRKSGRKIVWSSGTYRRAGLYGILWGPSSAHPKGYIAMYLKKTHQWTEISCYPNLGL